MHLLVEDRTKESKTEPQFANQKHNFKALYCVFVCVLEFIGLIFKVPVSLGYTTLGLTCRSKNDGQSFLLESGFRRGVRVQKLKEVPDDVNEIKAQIA